MCTGDEDTVTGFLLAGIGEIDAKKNGNFLVVNASMDARRLQGRAGVIDSKSESEIEN